ncbi:MAG: type II toxin-antitoxin system VapC family toxin [Candidatus Omnitrophica bacterium]|nr:type II toxin-antitoxin system VapC family toxin [Candidatus Omnitrophota bacterium]
MIFFLDTNICIDFLKGHKDVIEHLIKYYHPSQIKISTIVRAELIHGAFKSQNSHKNLEKVNSFLEPFEVVSFDIKASNIYGQIRAELEKRGEIIGPMDLLIAATVISHEGVLITENKKEFLRIEQLKIFTSI